MASNFPVPPVAAAGTAPPTGVNTSLIPAPAANATPLPISPRSPTAPHRPVSAVEDPKDVTTAALVLQDGTSFQGISFGSEAQSISGELVFQTGNTNKQKECKSKSEKKKKEREKDNIMHKREYGNLRCSNRHGWLSRVVDRSFVSWPDLGADLPVDRQLWCTFAYRNG